MGTFFLFSDECGAYMRKPNEGFLLSHPYYVRTSLFIPSSEYRNLSQRYFDLKKEYELPIEREIKWSYLWSLRIKQKHGKEISKGDELYFLKTYDYHRLINFVEEGVRLISNTPGSMILATVSRNHENWKMERKRFYEMHIENHMQRLQFEMTDNGYDLAVMFFDSVNSKINKLLREIYAGLISINRFEVEFSHIKDSLNIEYSHQSVGVQMADLAAGVVNSFFKAQHNPGNYERGLKMFEESIKPILRHLNGEICGYGLMEVPTDKKLRHQIRNYLK